MWMAPGVKHSQWRNTIYESGHSRYIRELKRLEMSDKKVISYKNGPKVKDFDYTSVANHFCTEHHNARQTFSYVAENNAYCSTCALFFLEKQNVSENCFACKDLRLYK